MTLNGNDIEWVSEIKHLGNNLNISRNDELDCQIKTSHVIGYVNKLIVNFGHLRRNVLNKLFKLYCCSFYGSQCGDLDLYISIKFVQHGIYQFAKFATCHIPRIDGF